MRRSLEGASDRYLLDRIVAVGDEPAFRELYRRHTPRLFQFILRFIGGVEQDAEDIVQESWVQAVKAAGGFAWKASFSTWLSGIALNRARELLRRRGRDLFELDESMVPAVVVPIGERIDLERALAMLPDGYRTVLVLHDIEGYQHNEIADRLGITVGTSKSQLFHARRYIRALLEPVTEAVT